MNYEITCNWVIYLASSEQVSSVCKRWWLICGVSLMEIGLHKVGGGVRG